MQLESLASSSVVINNSEGGDDHSIDQSSIMDDEYCRPMTQTNQVKVFELSSNKKQTRRN